MEAITIYPENPEQLKTVKSVLKALKVPFEPQFKSIPKHVGDSINRGLEQAAAGNAIGLEEFKKRHFSK